LGSGQNEAVTRESPIFAAGVSKNTKPIVCFPAKQNWNKQERIFFKNSEGLQKPALTGAPTFSCQNLRGFFPKTGCIFLPVMVY
jgi:hypothetical protein